MSTLLSSFLAKAAGYSKAIAAAGVALGVIAAAVKDGTVTADEVAAILISVGGIGAVFGVRNRPSTEAPADEG